MRSEPNLKNTFPPPHPPWCLCSSSWEHRDMGAMVSPSQVVYVAAQGEESLPCLSVGSFWWETVLHKLLQHESFPQAAVLPEVFLCGSLSTGCSSSKTAWSNVGQPKGHKPCQKNCSKLGLSSHESKVPCQEPAQAWASQGSGNGFKNHLDNAVRCIV